MDGSGAGHEVGRRRGGLAVVAVLVAVATVLATGGAPAGAAPVVTTVAGGHGFGPAADQLGSPQGVAVDAAGNVYVTDVGNLRVQRWSPGATSGVTVAGGHGFGSQSNQFASPWAVAVDAAGNVYVSDSSNHRVQRWAPGAGAGVTVAGGHGEGSAADQLSGPLGITLDDDGNLYVVDSGNFRVQRWAPGATEGVTVAGGNGRGTAPNQLDWTAGVAVDASHRVFVSEYLIHRVTRWTPGEGVGVVVAGGTGAGSEPDRLARPQLLAVDDAGNLYIAEYSNQRVQRWAPGATAGVTVAGGNGRGSAADQLNFPIGVAVDADRNVYVGDTGNNRVQRWATDLPAVRPGEATAVELDAGSSTVEVPVTLSRASSMPVTAAWSTTVVPGAPAGQADPGTDYVAASGTVTFAPGETNASVTVPINGDTVPEGDEYIVVVFHDPTLATMGGYWGLGFVTLVDDDQPAAVPGTAAVAEGASGTTTVAVPITLSSPSDHEVTVPWTTLAAPGAPASQADPASDYVASSGTVTFAPGQTEAVVEIEIRGDTAAEPDEYVLVSFHDPTGAKLGGPWGLGAVTILDDDT